MPLTYLFAALAVIGFVLVALSLFALRSSGASPAIARRLAGPPELKVGRLLDDDAADLPKRPVRLAGRIRCREPLDAGDGERLVAFHRDVEVLVGDSWRSVERMRETRSFELWDHDGSLTVDPAAAAEPLITIPHAWHGSADELEEPHASAAARLAERHGPLTEARAVTRTLNVTDRLLVLAQPVRGPDGAVRLEPPEGGYLISNLALDDAMRLLGGRHRRVAAAGVAGIALGIALVAIGGVGVLIAALIG
ncbi:MAG TPA: hypothetical protein VLA59_08140 [Patescibacteria group bacterium]|nr:hypothetical protein [Patescibacteria group bacterium]